MLKGIKINENVIENDKFSLNLLNNPSLSFSKLSTRYTGIPYLAITAKIPAIEITYEEDPISWGKALDDI